MQTDAALAVLTQNRSVTDGQTDGNCDSVWRARIASRAGKYQGCSLGLERLGLVSVSASYVSFT